MKTFIFFFLFLLTQPNYSNAQYTCDELVDAVKKSLNPSDKFATNSSSLIYKAELYDYEGIYIVIADFKRERSIYEIIESYDTYIFCGVPLGNWNRFKTEGFYGSYGEAFLEYIMDFKCNCK